LATNLLAFHLKVLDDAGIVRRVRSEGDRRRQYVQLRLDDQDVARLAGSGATPSGPAPGAVVFVCSANSARSQLAAAVWRRSSRLRTGSAGTRPAQSVHPLAMATARRHGLDLRDAVPRGLGALAEHVGPALLVAVCDNAHEELLRLCGDEPARGALHELVARPWLHWHIPDPTVVGTREAFESAFGQVTERVHRLATALAVAS
jgi:protein-tyrosine-phosphatase